MSFLKNMMTKGKDFLYNDTKRAALSGFGAATGLTGGAILTGGSISGLGVGAVAGGLAGAYATSKTGAMHLGGTALGGLAGGTANLMFGDSEDFGGAVGKGALMGLAGGVGIRSLTHSQGYLNRAGQAIGANLDDAGKASRVKELNKYNTKLGELQEGSPEHTKVLEKRDALQNKEVGSIRKFFMEMGETADERKSRILGEYEGLQKKAGNEVGEVVGSNPNKLTEADEARLAKLESDYGAKMNVSEETDWSTRWHTMKKAEGQDVLDTTKIDEIANRGYHDDWGISFTNEGYFRNVKDKKGDLFEHGAYPSELQEGMQVGYTHTETIQKVAGYDMHKSLTERSISSRNTSLMLGGAGLTGFAVGASHSSGRRKHKRGFNKNRGTRF